jgi:hypothetical protein
MRYETRTVRIGELVGPIDWDHETARAMPEAWHEAEGKPDHFTFNGRRIIAIGMYDGWPYWEPRPAVCFIGPMNSGEWAFFDSYGVGPGSIELSRAIAQTGTPATRSGTAEEKIEAAE